MADDINTLLCFYVSLLQEYGHNRLLISLLILLPYHTDIGFHDKIAQEQKKQHNHGVTPAASLYTTCSLKGRSATFKKKKKKGDDFETCHETELFINMPDKNKVRAHFSWPE